MYKFLKVSRSFQVTQVRFKYRGNRPRPDILSRRVLTEVTKPFRSDDLHPDHLDMCSIVKYRKEQQKNSEENIIDEDLYEQFLIKELRKELSSCRLIGLCQLDSMGMIDRLILKNPFMQVGLKLVIYPHQACVKMLSTSRLKHLSCLVNEHTVMVVGVDEGMTKAMLKVLKSLPNMHLLGGLVGDRVMTKGDIIKYASLPNLDTSRSQLLMTLNHAGQSTRSLLQYQQQNLTRNLDFIINRADGNNKDKT